MLDMKDDLAIPLPQSAEFAAAMQRLGRRVREMRSACAGRDRLRWLVQGRRFGPLGRVDLISRGPVARDPECLIDWLRRFQHWQDGRPLLLNADGLPAGALRSAGFWPLVTAGTLAMLPLGEAATMRAALQQKWRNRLNRSEGVGLRVTRHALDAGHWLLAAEARQARARGYRALPPQFSQAFAAANPGKALVFEARFRGQPVAAVLVLRHGAMATWQIGHVTEQGRALNAMNLTLWTAMDWLAEQGHRVLDLGLINTDDAQGLARFKLGTGAACHRLSGTWLHQGMLAPLAKRLPVRLAA